MRPLPVYPPYRAARVPNSQRWMSACAVLVLLAGGGLALFQPEGAGAGRIVGGMVGAAVLTGGLWLIRQLYYRLSVHNARLYDRLVKQQQQAWWTEHQRAFVLSEWVLLGPAGADTRHWLRLLAREHRLPEVKNEPGGSALRIARTMVDAAAEREAHLAKMLVMQWQTQRAETSLPRIQRCYWQGTLLAWQSFCLQMQVTFPGVVLPDEPDAWCGEESLSDLAATAPALAVDEAILVAGCQSAPASFSSLPLAGESAALWLVGHDGSVCLTRGEVYDSGGKDTLVDVSERAQRQSQQAESPEVCMLFSQPALPTLAQSGWNVTHHIQDLNWGHPGDMEMLIVLTLAAIGANHYQEPCGWIAKDPQHTLAFGIVKPYGQGK